jgi:hypothetical protein
MDDIRTLSRSDLFIPAFLNSTSLVMLDKKSSGSRPGATVGSKALNVDKKSSCRANSEISLCADNAQNRISVASKTRSPLPAPASRSTRQARPIKSVAFARRRKSGSQSLDTMSRALYPK